jgi:hypothetical protein
MALEAITGDFSQLSISPELNEARRASIRDALQKYKAECLRQNLRDLCIAWQEVHFSGEEEIKSGRRTAEEVDRAVRRAWKRDYWLPKYEDLQILLAPEESPKRSQIIRRLWLDGVNHDPVNYELRKKWWGSIWMAILKKKDIITPEQFPPGLPNDLQYLTTLVDGVLGPDVLRDHEKQFRDFVPSFADIENSSIRKALLEGKDDGLCVPCLGNWKENPRSLEREDLEDYNNYLPGIWSDELSGHGEWDIAVGLSLSSWPYAGYRSVMMYCCPRRENGGWAWRYGWENSAMVSSSDLYDTVEEYLEWYAHWGMAKDEDVKLSPRILNFR